MTQGASEPVGPLPRRRRGRPKKQDRGKAEIERAERISEACRYRAEGLTFREIAQAMRVGLATVHRWVWSGLAMVGMIPPAVRKGKQDHDAYRQPGHGHRRRRRIFGMPIGIRTSRRVAAAMGVQSRAATAGKGLHP